MDVVLTAARLHDIARDEPNHARRSAKVARRILRAQSYQEDFIERVAHCIEAHSFSSRIKPRTIEAKVLSDADKLDAMGAVGVARAFIYSGEAGRSLEETLNHFTEKLLKLYDALQTETARQLARKRHEFLVDFFHRLVEELFWNP